MEHFIFEKVFNGNILHDSLIVVDRKQLLKESDQVKDLIRIKTVVVIIRWNEMFRTEISETAKNKLSLLPTGWL